jgi:GTP 3',8-cyclase
MAKLCLLDFRRRTYRFEDTRASFLNNPQTTPGQKLPVEIMRVSVPRRCWIELRENTGAGWCPADRRHLVFSDPNRAAIGARRVAARRAQDSGLFVGSHQAYDGPMDEARLIDGFGRVARALRVSVTDRCNLRCRYCMPAEGLPWLPREDVLTDDEIVTLVGVFARLGVRDVRVTGGEPLVRPGVAAIVRRIVAIPEIGEVSLTTNGVLLAAQVDALVDAGLRRVNVSLDSLDPERFEALTRRRDLDRVLAGLEACERHEVLRPIKVNVVSLRDVTEAEVLDLAEFARRKPYVIRFIEVMPLDAPREWRRDLVLPGSEIRAMIAAKWPLVQLDPDRPSSTATRWGFADGQGELQFVSSVTESFCAQCDRLRLTADGQLRTCLFAEVETDLRKPLRTGANEADLAEIIKNAVLAKEAGHGMADPAWTYEGRSMSMIGG